MPLVTGGEVMEIVKRAVFHFLRDDQRLGVGEFAIVRRVVELGAFLELQTVPEKPEGQEAAFLVSCHSAGHGLFSEHSKSLGKRILNHFEKISSRFHLLSVEFPIHFVHHYSLTSFTVMCVKNSYRQIWNKNRNNGGDERGNLFFSFEVIFFAQPFFVYVGKTVQFVK